MSSMRSEKLQIYTSLALRLNHRRPIVTVIQTIRSCLFLFGTEIMDDVDFNTFDDLTGFGTFTKVADAVPS